MPSALTAKLGKIFVVYGNVHYTFPSLTAILLRVIELKEWSVTVQAGGEYLALKSLESLSSAVIRDRLCRREFISELRGANLVIGHAGWGFIEESLNNDIFPLVVPRRATLKEHVNDHQVDFVEKYKEAGIFEVLNSHVDMTSCYLKNMLGRRPSRKHIIDNARLIEDLLIYMQKGGR